MLIVFILQHFYRKHRSPQPDKSIARRQIKQPFTHLQQIVRTTARHNCCMKRLMTQIPLIKHFLAGVTGFQLTEQMRFCENVCLPLIATAGNRQTH
ncbi:Uncharacterised protein [Shigella sonnei]|nr:Uncharacterised protein [Shigella sonnei]CSP64544.1 Uncharacterised protein [Shigella sonnei]